MIKIWLLWTRNKYRLDGLKRIDLFLTYCVTPYSSSDRIFPFFFQRISGGGLPDAKHFNCTVVPSGWMTVVGPVDISSPRERNSGASEIGEGEEDRLIIYTMNFSFTDLHSMNQYPRPLNSVVQYSSFYSIHFHLLKIIAILRSWLFKSELQITIDINSKLGLNIAKSVNNMTFVQTSIRKMCILNS